jgi:hypothetical protein
MKAHLSTLAAVLGALLVAGCSDGDGSGGVGSCSTMSSASTCADYTGSGWSESEVKGACNGTYSADPCPTENRLGRCKLGAGSAKEYVLSYYSGGGVTWMPGTAQTNCTSQLGGQWL